MSEPEHAGGQGGVEYEQRDIHPRAIVQVTLALAGVTLVTSVVLLGMFRLLARNEERKDPPARALPAEAQRLPPAPRLQERPFDDVRALRREEREWLESYGILDAQAGTVRLPIERAMELYVQRANAPALATPPSATPHPAAPGAHR